MGAGIVECGVTFTKDHVLVCRHARDDPATRTDISTGDLAGTCAVPFAPAAAGSPATAECRTSDLTAAEFATLRPKVDGFGRTATTPEAAQAGLEPWRTTGYAGTAHLLTRAGPTAPSRSMGAMFVPELEAPVVAMADDAWTREAYAQAMIDAYKIADVPRADVWAQSFDLSDILDRIANEPAGGSQAL